MVIDLSMARLDRETDNCKVTVEELLSLALRDVRRGEYTSCNKAFVCIISEDDSGYSLNGYRCGVSRVEELGYIEAFKQQCWAHWNAS